MRLQLNEVSVHNERKQLGTEKTLISPTASSVQ